MCSHAHAHAYSHARARARARGELRRVAHDNTWRDKPRKGAAGCKDAECESRRVARGCLAGKTHRPRLWFIDRLLFSCLGRMEGFGIGVLMVLVLVLVVALAVSLVKGFQFHRYSTTFGCGRRHGSACVPCRGDVVVIGGLMKYPYFVFMPYAPNLRTPDHRHTCGRWRYGHPELWKQQ